MTTTIRVAQRAAGALALALASAGTLGSQSVARRVEQVRDGTVRMSFASRAGVCGNGRGNISTGADRLSARQRDEWEDACEPGPVRVALDLAGGRVLEVRAYVGGRWKAAGTATDFGTVSTAGAVDYLLDVAARGDGKGAGEAIFPATLADSVVVWPRLLTLARDESRTREARNQAVFWVSQAAGEKATEGLVEVAGDRSTDEEVRLQAVFAVSLRPADESVPALINMAGSSKDPAIRKQAIFWLGRKKDPRAMEFFEKLLARK